ncbi:MAG: transcriptional repressor NrdR [Sedimentisphaerales bacterium]|nr:transcriptional repressor NrdR [Sedimentisphaerales bacterium]
MRCPFCKEDKDKVVDSRSGEKGRVIRRRRECLACHRRFTTYERIEEAIKLMVVKKDGSRVPFDRQRIIAGVQKACYKRPISAQKIDELARDVEEEIVIKFSQEVSSEVIGNLTIARLRSLDKVAYIRYASVYREFDDLAQFLDEVQGAMEVADDSPGQNQLF